MVQPFTVHTSRPWVKSSYTLASFYDSLIAFSQKKTTTILCFYSFFSLSFSHLQSINFPSFYLQFLLVYPFFLFCTFSFSHPREQFSYKCPTTPQVQHISRCILGGNIVLCYRTKGFYSFNIIIICHKFLTHSLGFFDTGYPAS